MENQLLPLTNHKDLQILPTTPYCEWLVFYPKTLDFTTFLGSRFFGFIRLNSNLTLITKDLSRVVKRYGHLYALMTFTWKEEGESVAYVFPLRLLEIIRLPIHVVLFDIKSVKLRISGSITRFREAQVVLYRVGSGSVTLINRTIATSLVATTGVTLEGSGGHYLAMNPPFPVVEDTDFYFMCSLTGIEGGYGNKNVRMELSINEDDGEFVYLPV